MKITFSKLLAEAIETGCIPLEVVAEGLASSNIRDRAEVYEVLSEHEYRKLVPGIGSNTILLFFQLEYLLECIRNNADYGENTELLSRGEACLELSVPLDSFWTNGDPQIETRYLRRVGRFLENSVDYIEEIPTHFLEAIFQEPFFQVERKKWVASSSLKKYIDELDDILK